MSAMNAFLSIIGALVFIAGGVIAWRQRHPLIHKEENPKMRAYLLRRIK